MAETPIYERWEIQDYTAFNKTQIPLSGELVYFNNIELWIKNVCHVIGDGTKQVQQLPFIEEMIIESSVNINISAYGISGQKVLIQNTHVSNPIIITPILNPILPGALYKYKYNGSGWVRLYDTADDVLKITDNYTITDDERYRDYLVDTTIKKFIVITLPLLINNQNKSVFRINHTGNGIIRIQGQGSDTINNYLTEIRFFSQFDFAEFKPSANTWCLLDQNIIYDTGRVRRSDWTFAKLGNSLVGYDNITSGALEIGGRIIGGTSGATGKIAGFTGTNIILINVTVGGIFLDNEIITGVDFAFSASINEPTGSNLNKDTNILIVVMGDYLHFIDKKFLIYQTDDNNSVIERKELSFTTTPSANTTQGASYFYIGINNFAFVTALQGLDYVSISGSRIVITTQNWYYRHRFRIFY